MGGGRACPLAGWRRLPIPDVTPPTHAVMTVVVRPGRTLLGRSEHHWLTAWRYANRGLSVFTSDLILVTEHGWTDLMTQWAGHTPAMIAG